MGAVRPESWCGQVWFAPVLITQARDLRKNLRAIKALREMTAEEKKELVSVNTRLGPSDKVQC